LTRELSTVSGSSSARSSKLACYDARYYDKTAISWTRADQPMAPRLGDPGDVRLLGEQ
jgi:hypothetical protein